MKLCFPTLNDQGMNSKLSDHFGSAPFFTVFDTQTREIESIKNQGVSHQHGKCNPVKDIESLSVQAVIVRGLGRRALDKLNSAGISVYKTEAGTVEPGVAEYENGACRLMVAQNACGQNHTHHGGCH